MLQCAQLYAQLHPDGLECDAPVLNGDTALCLKIRLRILFDGSRPKAMGELTIGDERLESDGKLYERGNSDNAQCHLLHVLEVSAEDQEEGRDPLGARLSTHYDHVMGPTQ